MGCRLSDKKKGRRVEEGHLARKKWIAAFMLLAVASTANAGSAARLACVEEAAKRFDHNPNLLRALIEVESSGKCQRVHPKNADGSYDIGCMGINTRWLPLLQKKFGLTEQDLYDPCTNINIGAWVLAKNIRGFGNNWRAVGAYNAKNENKRIEYVWKVNAKLYGLQRPS